MAQNLSQSGQARRKPCCRKQWLCWNPEDVDLQVRKADPSPRKNRGDSGARVPV